MRRTDFANCLFDMPTQKLWITSNPCIDDQVHVPRTDMRWQREFRRQVAADKIRNTEGGSTQTNNLQVGYFQTILNQSLLQAANDVH